MRDASKLPDEIRNRVEVVEGSHGDDRVIGQALNEADALFWIAPPDVTRTPDEVYLDFTRPAADAIRANRVKRVVSVTALGRGTRWQDRAGLVTASMKMDDMLMETGAAFRGLAMPSFMDNMLRQAVSIRDQGLMFGPEDPDRKAPTTATRDMGAVAARLLS
ncbi:NmrA family transcriptional regulator, partial [Paracoccus liaowanqingii]